MTAKKTDKLDIKNEAERARSMIDKYIRDPKTREELYKGLTPSIIQFLLRWEFDRDENLEERVIEIVMKKMRDIYLADNDAICKNVVKEVAEVVAPINLALEVMDGKIDNVAIKVSEIQLELGHVKDRLSAVEKNQKSDTSEIENIKKRLDTKENRLDQVEKQIAVLQPEPILALVDEIHQLRPTIKHLTQSQKWWNISLRILIAVAISVIILLIWHTKYENGILEKQLIQDKTIIENMK